MKRRVPARNSSNIAERALSTGHPLLTPPDLPFACWKHTRHIPFWQVGSDLPLTLASLRFVEKTEVVYV